MSRLCRRKLTPSWRVLHAGEFGGMFSEPCLQGHEEGRTGPGDTELQHKAAAARAGLLGLCSWNGSPEASCTVVRSPELMFPPPQSSGASCPAKGAYVGQSISSSEGRSHLEKDLAGSPHRLPVLP